MNHIGPKVFKSWKVALEKALSPEGKLDVICAKLGIDLAKGEGPRQTVRELSKFRNDLAHGKTVHIEEEDVRDADQYFEEFFGKRPLATREVYGTKENAERAREDIEQVMRLLHEKAGLENDPLFGFGMYSASASLQQDY